jgi:Integrin alpha
VAEVFKGGRKFSRVRLVVKSKDAATHTKEQIVLVRKNSLDGCFRELVYLKEGTTDITTPIKFLGRGFSRVVAADSGCGRIQVRILIIRNSAIKQKFRFKQCCGGHINDFRSQNFGFKQEFKPVLPAIAQIFNRLRTRFRSGRFKNSDPNLITKRPDSGSYVQYN